MRKKFVLLTLLLSGLLVWFSGGQAHAAGNAAVQYANSHWNCANAACTSTVPAGAPQDNFECAEFVSRSLAAAGLVPRLAPSSPKDAYGRYPAKNGRTYDLLWVGWTSTNGYNTTNGLYQYLIQNGIGVDIGNTPSKATPGDVVIYHEDRGHTGLLVQTGNDPLVDTHNNARYHVPYMEYPDLTIVHIGKTTPPTSLPPDQGSWPTERLGSTGENVASIQLLLAVRGYTLSIDSDFGPQTQATVKAFQAAQHLTVDGIVGPQTWSVLVITTREGSSGSAVVALQQQLNTNGARLTVDGSFGPLTNAALRSYQSRHKLSVDGIAGPQTWQSLVNQRSS